MTATWTLAIFFTLGWIPLLAFRTENLRRAIPVFDREERLWVIASPVLLGTHVALSCVLLTLEAAIPSWRVAVSVAVFVGGISLWIWARTVIGPVFVPRQPDEPPRQFVVGGPFRWVRNPSYFGTLVAGAATSLAAGRPVLLATLALAGWALWVRAGQEERRMEHSVGPAWDDYRRDVRRLVPFLF